MTKKQEEILERYDFTFTIDEECIEIEGYSPAGENLIFSINKDENLKDFFKEEFENFDEEEHILMWLEAKRNGVGGVPDVFTLVDDTKEIKKLLENLAIEL